MSIGETRPLIGNFFEITSYRNTGAAFSTLQHQRWFFVFITIIVVIYVVRYLHKSVHNGRRLMPIALGLLLGGAIGNFVDRLLNGEVVDFLEFHFFQRSLFGHTIDYISPIFNIADSGIVVGVALIFLNALLGWKRDGSLLEHH
jgi:signal peptidase II